ncbi:LAGLIDADG family homing endonuclease [Streptosporangium sp. CA-135522]|uniref:LAGLIDADG family homing endonuclease n=1 Tax=Streptosporangium sp. CA-135522 TaxID=3240072 RepID=UPI003D8C1D1B
MIAQEPLALDTPVPTPSGWSTMADLKIGDYVFSRGGKPILVWGVAPIKHGRPCYRVTFDDGDSVVSDATHRWWAFDRKSKQRWAEWTTDQMATANWYGGLRFAVPRPEPLKCASADLPLDPYVLGMWLGDGDSRVATLTVGRDDFDETLLNLEEAGMTTSVYDYGEDRGAVQIRFNHGQRYGKQGTSQHALRSLGVLGNKHVPDLYLWASHEQRLELLQGLMDSDGYVNERGNCTFTSSSRALVDAVEHLARSLGWRAATGAWQSDERWKNRAAGTWRVSFTPSGDVPFKLKRKSSRCRTLRSESSRAIMSIEPVDSVSVRCIAVDSDDQLFLAGRSMLPTHNYPLHCQKQPSLRCLSG